MNGIFISYRREDSSPYAGRIFDSLTRLFPRTRVFMDYGGIEPGEDFATRIEAEVQSCDVLLAIIGKKWMTITDSAGRRRLEKTDDWVRFEIQTALARNIRVIPCLVGGAGMPSNQELPQELSPLTRRQKLELTDARFRSDLGLLVDTISKIVKRGSRRNKADNSLVSLRGSPKKKFDQFQEMVKIFFLKSDLVVGVRQQEMFT